MDDMDMSGLRAKKLVALTLLTLTMLGAGIYLAVIGNVFGAIALVFCSLLGFYEVEKV